MSGLVDLMFALVLVGGGLLIALPQIIALTLQPAQNDAGNQLALIQAASATYIKNHFNVLVAGIGVGGAVSVTPAVLIADGDLPPGFNDSNVFGQQHVLVVAQPSAGVLDGMAFTYGGDAIPDIIAVRVAQAGPANAMVVLAADPTNFEGAAGGETVAVSEFAVAGYAIEPGHLAAHIEPAQYAAEAPFLNRYYTGNNDDNTMHADLNMGGNNLAAAKTVTAIQQVTTPTIVDPVTPGYQITMAGSSTVNDLTANGSVTSADFLHLSDIRLKRDITDLADAVDVITRLRGRHFVWRSDGRPDFGFVAQEVQQVLPEAVERRPDGLLAVRYDILAAPLVEAVKWQGRRIDEQSRRLAELQARLHSDQPASPPD